MRFAHANFGHAHLRNGKVEVQIITENAVASELESTFLTEFRDKVSLWLSSKLFSYSS